MIQNNKFSSVCASRSNPKWNDFVKRKDELYRRESDIRSEFARDYNRILHCTAYRRLKHKTQVFFATGNDHVCTRIEHVNHVAAVSYTISKFLGLNTELTNAIAIGHDLGHAPFGHEGEKVLKTIARKQLKESFWHERNSLWFVDKLETLSDQRGKQRNLSLTYAVRDGIISHCGEVDENAIKPRDKMIDLNNIEKANQYQPFSWEGCVVKKADKISYLGRDIEDALTLGILSDSQLEDLSKILNKSIHIVIRDINNAVLIHRFIIDLCESSSPESGIRFSEQSLQLMGSIKKFNFENIYSHPRLEYFKKYAGLILKSIFDRLLDFCRHKNVLQQIKEYERLHPLLCDTFSDWLIKYSDIDLEEKKKRKYDNQVVYTMGSRDVYIRAIIHYISGMTDSFAIKIFDELTRFL